MYCPYCGYYLQDEAQYCPNCGGMIAQTQNAAPSVQWQPVPQVKSAPVKKQSGGMNLLIVVPGILLLIGVVLGLLLWRPWAGARDAKVESVEDILTYLQKEGAACGYENAFAELSELRTTHAEGASYSRFQQHYEGIPVYGQTVVCAVDEEGEILSVTGNVMDVNEELSLTPTLTEEQAEAAIAKYLSEDIGTEVTDVDFGGLTEDKLCIYSLSNLPDTLAYDLAVEFTVEETTYGCQMIVNADNGEIIYLDTGVRTDGTVKGDLTGESGRVYEDVEYIETQDGYQLYDPNRYIAVYAATGKRKILWLDDKDIPIFPIVWDEGGTAVTWSDGGTPDAEAVDVYANLQITYDYFDQVLENQSYDGAGVRDVYAYNGVEYRYDAEKNRYFNFGDNACFSGSTNALVFGGDEVITIDTVAHEYMHGVEQHHSRMAYEGESGAIMEGLSDIFGELVEDWDKEKRNAGDIDWEHGDRILHNPGVNNNPDYYYNDPHWGDTTNLEEDGGYRHKNSTVISHAAYLMYQGGITPDELAHLWYNAMLMMPTDCSFYECRELVELAARHLNFTEEQQKVIDDAFDAVGIITDNEVKELPIKRGGNLNILDFAGDAYDNYSLRFWRLEEYAVDGDPLLYPLNRTPVKYVFLSSEEPYKMKSNPFGKGVYLLETKDLENPEKWEQFFIIVTEDAPEHLDIPANFGSLRFEGTVTMEETGEPVAGAEVTVSVGSVKHQHFTDEHGHYDFHITDPSEEQYTIQAKSGSYSSNEVTLAVKVDENGKAIESAEGRLKRENRVDLELAYQGESVWILTETEKMGSPLIYYYDDDYMLSEIVEYYSDGGDEWRRWKYSFNSNGDISEVLVYWNGEPSSKYSYTYDEKGNLLSEITYWFDENAFQLKQCNKYRYDDAGNCIEYQIDTQGESQVHSYIWKCAYDALGNRISEKQYSENGRLLEEHQYKYDAHGNQVEWKKYDKWGNLDWCDTFEYDEKRNMIRRSIIMNDEVVNFTIAYHYDSNDNLTQIIENKNGEFYSYQKYTYTEVFVEPDQVETIKAHQQYIIFDME